jgi:predicted ATPase/class 3 adenylate cyclase/Tfp pilus assembly protein PilF
VPLVDTRTLVFADIVDSTAHAERIGDERAAALWAEHDHQARRLLAEHGGREIDRSDGFFLLFERSAEALRFATAYHCMLGALGIAARVGVHTGAVSLRANNPQEVAHGAKPLEVDGLAKPLAARIMALASGGRTLISGATAATLEPNALVGRALHRHGHYRFKGIAEPVEVAEVAASQAACAPPADVEKAYRVVRGDDGLWHPLRSVPHNLLPERDDFVGREAELRELADRLDAADTRLVTVLGPGGIGKTRLVHRYARAWLGEWPGGVAFCDLSEARSLDGIHYAVALALGVPLGKDDPALQLGHAIAGRGRCLVILDNFEQVQAYAEATVGRWLDRAPEARFVVTSRERLQLPGEQAVALEPLDPDGDAMQLFEARARAQRTDFAIVEANRAQVARIVRLLDGLPLAVELAAARVRVLSPAQILDRMKDRFALLAGARGMAARQATLKAAIDWSWDLLAPWEQAALAQCAVFEGGFTLEAAEAEFDLTRWPEAPAALDVIQSLVDKSLLRAWWPKHDGERIDIGEPFFGMYLSIHEYAGLRLRALGEAACREAERRHGHYFAAFGSDEAQQALFTHSGAQRRRTLAVELDNLLSGCRRAMLRGEPDIAAGCFIAAWTVLEAQGPYGLAAELGAQVGALDGLPEARRARVQMATAHALRTVGRASASDALLAQVVAAARQSGDRRTEAMSLRLAAIGAHRDGRIAEADQHFSSALALLDALDDRVQRAVLLANLANLRSQQGRIAEARAAYDEAIALHREVGNRAAEGISLGNLGAQLFDVGEAAEAQRAYEAALAIHRETGSRQQEAITLANVGILLHQQGQLQQAAEQYRAALAIHREIGNRRGEGVTLTQMGDLHQAQRDFAAARACYDEALRIHREVGNLRFEAGTLSNLGAMLAAQGDPSAGLDAMASAERRLRELGDLVNLAVLLCSRGEVLEAHGDPGAARRALAEAQSLAAQLGATPGSHVGRSLDALKRALG